MLGHLDVPGAPRAVPPLAHVVLIEISTDKGQEM